MKYWINDSKISLMITILRVKTKRIKSTIYLLVGLLVRSAVSHGIANTVGSWIVGNPSSAAVKKVAEKILEIFDDSNTFGLAKRLRDVLFVKTQIVSGMYYDLILDVGLLNCTYAQAATNANCKVTKPWTSTEQITRYKCWEFMSSLSVACPP
ncbi:hypothetical protein HELRODRAFT_176338 [Helobdella robusta]|uniref:Cystatin domain-containing protein n=1 Tax=Helobdella robusta TaxID=6412 RepID=T1FAE5_HELRO|nr:hypothetical protein HELRODRAFT_176338 [Helobdella robusta]ESO00031.1 hypothetical protein HELRODRAFT_176338 [Helobdella robusta]